MVYTCYIMTYASYRNELDLVHLTFAIPTHFSSVDLDIIEMQRSDAATAATAAAAAAVDARATGNNMTSQLQRRR